MIWPWMMVEMATGSNRWENANKNARELTESRAGKMALGKYGV